MEVMASRVGVSDASGVGEARRMAAAAARAAGFDETDVGRVALVATEVATNLCKHAGAGEIFVTSLGPTAPDGSSVELVALDRGPGIRDLTVSLEDGHSTAGSSGFGLGAIRRAASVFDIYSTPEHGTALVARVVQASRVPHKPPVVEVGALCVPLAGERVCGDSWTFAPSPGGGGSLLVCDGLGHGPLAAAAAREAVEAFTGLATLTPLRAVEGLHHRLKPTRGAAIAVAQIDIGGGVVTYCGLGNISGVLLDDQGSTRHMVSQNGVAGHHASRLQEFSYPAGRDTTLLMHTDGIATRWHLGTYPGLLARHPSIISAVIHRDFTRRRDDAAIVTVSWSAARRGRTA